MHLVINIHFKIKIIAKYPTERRHNVTSTVELKKNEKNATE